MAVSLSALRAGRPLPSRKFILLISVRGCVEPRAMVRPEGLGKLKESTSWRIEWKTVSRRHVMFPMKTDKRSLLFSDKPVAITRDLSDSKRFQDFSSNSTLKFLLPELSVRNIVKHKNRFPLLDLLRILFISLHL
jgi:hypothetical protein